jgi:hypothetical protein
MKQISAILIACFLCGGASQVSAQQPQQKLVVNVKTVALTASAKDYVVQENDHFLLFTGNATGSQIKLPNPADHYGRVIQFINRAENIISIVSPTPTTGINAGLAITPLPMANRTNSEWFCDGVKWSVLNKNF